MIEIYVDHRETKSGIPSALEELGAEVIIKTLEVGDYHVSDDVIIERKTTSDFLHSIIDEPGHLYGQLSDMMREYNRSILIIEGSPMDLYTKREVGANAIDGMLLAVAEGFGVPILWTLSVDHTARMIYRAAEKQQIARQHKSGSPHGKRSHMTLPQKQVYVVSSIGGGVGPTMAVTLLEHFRSVKAVMAANINELVEVEGIGLKTAEKIHEIVRGKYKK